MVYKMSILRSYEQPEEELDNCTPFIHLYKLCRQATQTLSVNVQKIQHHKLKLCNREFLKFLFSWLDAPIVFFVLLLNGEVGEAGLIKLSLILSE